LALNNRAKTTHPQSSASSARINNTPLFVATRLAITLRLIWEFLQNSHASSHPLISALYPFSNTNRLVVGHVPRHCASQLSRVFKHPHQVHDGEISSPFRAALSVFRHRQALLESCHSIRTSDALHYLSHFSYSSAMIISPVPSTAVAHIFSTRATANNVTTGDGRVGWVSAGSGRSTSDILWSCFSIPLVCTWKCIHFNVPSIHKSEARWHMWGIVCWPGKRLLLVWMYKVGWMIGIALAPELGVAIAMYQYLGAREWSNMLSSVDLRRTLAEAREV
jgi:hypothetical protein